MKFGEGSVEGGDVVVAVDMFKIHCIHTRNSQTINKTTIFFKRNTNNK